MATTTSTDNTGLLDYLKPFFKQENRHRSPVGVYRNRSALKLGENCDADVLLVHAPETEKKFVAAGFGINRREVMFNDLSSLVRQQIRPASKAKPSGTATPARPFKTNRACLSAGATSPEPILQKWNYGREADWLSPTRTPWYVQAGQGMLATIQMAART